MSDYFHEQKVRNMLEPKERDIPCKECFIFKIEEERVNQFIANYKASTSLCKMIPLSVIEDIKAEMEKMAFVAEIFDENNPPTYTDANLPETIEAEAVIETEILPLYTILYIIDRKVNEVKNERT